MTIEPYEALEISDSALAEAENILIRQGPNRFIREHKNLKCSNEYILTELRRVFGYTVPEALDIMAKS